MSGVPDYRGQMVHTRGLRFTAHCICGNSIDVRTPHQDTIQFIESLWTKLHSSDGHAPATPSQASRIRARERNRELRRSVDGA